MSGRPAALLARYGFQRTGTGPDTYRRTSGPFVVRVAFLDAGPKLDLGLLSRTPGVPELVRPWSVNTGPEPDAAALEAAWFIAVIEGLTPPVLGGRVLGTGTTNQEGRR